MKPKAYERWTDEDLEKVHGVSEQIATATLLGLYTGQRLSDVVQIRWDQIRSNAVHIKQQKTGTRVIIPLHPELRDYLLRLHKRGDYVVCQYNGSKYTAQVFRVKFAREMRRIGITKKFHGLRATMACRLAEAGASLNEIMAVGGWKSPRQAMGYMDGVQRTALAQAAIGRLK